MLDHIQTLGGFMTFMEMFGNGLSIFEILMKKKPPMIPLRRPTFFKGGSAWGKKVSAFSVAKRRANLIDRYNYRGFRVALKQVD